MNIQQAKREITNTLQAYLQKDALGNYRIPGKRQRPVLLMGPPGIGKTQIMEQIAEETGVGLVAYTITHHTRQSAIGLPFITKKEYQGEEVSVTQYTMSEILASVYDMMAETGLKEGILFLDEINCVSETLTPVMLQFLQYKTFGNRSLPEGWMIVAAGNPPEYNKSAREFDVVTMDRLKYISVEEDFGVWKEYAYRQGIHPGIISYLDIKKENFYHVENSVDGMRFVTPRGWEDLSEMLLAYEAMDLRLDRLVAEQYIQVPEIARDFANYLDLYYKYQTTYQVEEILAGTWEPIAQQTLRTAPFDEKLAVMGLLFSRLTEWAQNTRLTDLLADRVYQSLLAFRDALEEGAEPAGWLEARESSVLSEIRNKKTAGQLSAQSRNLLQKEANLLQEYAALLRGFSGDAMDAIRQEFGKLTDERETLADETSKRFDNVFRFLEDALGQHQEMVLFVTEITAGYDTSWFVENFGCDAYYRHNRELLFDDVESQLREEIMAAQKEG